MVVGATASSLEDCDVPEAMIEAAVCGGLVLSGVSCATEHRRGEEARVLAMDERSGYD